MRSPCSFEARNLRALLTQHSSERENDSADQQTDAAES
jgi:hypothetical protein